MNRLAKLTSIAGLLVSAAFLILALWRLDWEGIRSAILSARPWPWMPLAVAAYLAGHIVRGIRCRFIVRARSSLPLITASNVVVVGYAANNVLPARLGELVRSGLLADRAGIPLSQALAITIVERILDGWILLLLLGLSLFFVDFPAWALGILGLGAVVFLAATCAVILAVVAPNWVTGMVARSSRFPGERFRDQALRLVTRAILGLACLRRPQVTVILLFQSLVVWIFEAGLFLLVLPAFGLEFNPAWALWAMTVTNLSILAPSAPGYIGTFHFFCQKALVVCGVSGAVAASYAFTVHLLFYIPITLWGLGAMLRYGIELGGLAARVRSSRSSPAGEQGAGDELGCADLESYPADGRVSARGGTTPFQVALAEVFVPRGLSLDPKSRTEVVREAAAFAHDEIKHLPPHLFLALRIGLLGFRVFTVVRCGRRFSRLSLKRRRQVTEWWAFGPVFVLRQILRPIRCCVLLALYECLARRGAAAPSAAAAGAQAPSREVTP